VIPNAARLEYIGHVNHASDAPRGHHRALLPTGNGLERDDTRPYFLWWTDCTVGELRGHLKDPEPRARAYWLGALLREANSRDVWLFTSPDEIRQLWPEVVRHLGRARAMWAWLLGLEDYRWPPPEARGA
jgi:hypothetical protein